LREGQVRPLAFMDECAGFPAAKNDDQVHAMTQALLRLMRTNGGPRRTWIG
jgi:phage terminase large subunit-like protein